MILVRRYAKEKKISFIWSSGVSDIQVILKLNIKIKVTNQAPAIQKVDSAIYWTNLCSVDNAIGHFSRALARAKRAQQSTMGNKIWLTILFILASF